MSKKRKKKSKENGWFLFVFIFFLILYLNKDRFVSLIRSYDVIENTYLSISKYSFGLDVSQYQGYIKWNEVAQSKHPIKFIFVRATMGKDGGDKYYNRNWEKAKSYGFVRGAYHYYRPNENSKLQFDNFKSVVTLQKGDFYPVLDIEEISSYGTENLILGLKNWLELAEAYYGVKPIIYTGQDFYDNYIKKRIKGYPLWIAAYSGKHKLRGINWRFHQFSENIWVKGIRENVDGNDFRGKEDDLKKYCIK